jgi:hypothetical protein
VPGIVVPDGAIEDILTKLFDRFNFTVSESTPLDVDVAVDPEMLGKVFEESKPSHSFDRFVSLKIDEVIITLLLLSANLSDGFHL